MTDTAPEVPPTTGPIAGKYDVLRLIGRGGMGTVWEGRHTTLGTRVAIKFIDTEYADSQEARTRFDNEARAAANIQSKHAIQIFDHGVTGDGKPYIVMELLQGEPLDARLDRLGRIPLPEAARILRQVARALARAHERGIVHRDLKPENIFLVRTPDDDEEIAKVLDFGIAKFKRLDGTGTHSSMPTSSTKTGAVLGTPFYMAPEQARGLREIDHRCDLWSMGVIAFKCVCGVLPFEGVSVGDLLVKICTTPAPTPSSLVPGLGAAFDGWFQRAMEKDPARRFQSAAELSDGLAYAAGLSVKRLGSGSLVPSSDGVVVAPAVSVRSGSTQPSLSGPNVTSAPFTSPSPRASGSGSSKGAIVFAVVATIVGCLAVALALFVQLGRKAGGGLVAGVPSGAAVVTAVPPSGIVAAAAGEGTLDAGPLDSLDLPPIHDPMHEKGPHHPAPHGPRALPPPIPTQHLPSPAAPPVTATPPPAPAPPAVTIAPTPKPVPAPAPKPSANAMDPGY